MPPKTKFDKNQIVKAAYELMEEKGIEAVVARDVAKKLGSTTAPIFTCFKNMEELIENVYNMATDNCEAYLNEAINYKPAFKEFGIRWYKYAKAHPNAYKFIFMKHKNDSKYDFVNVSFIDIIEPLIDDVANEFSISREDSHYLINMMCVYSMGLCSLLVNGVKTFSDEEISVQISNVFVSMLFGVKNKNNSVDMNLFKMMYDHVGDLPIKRS